MKTILIFLNFYFLCILSLSGQYSNVTIEYSIDLDRFGGESANSSASSGMIKTTVELAKEAKIKTVLYFNSNYSLFKLQNTLNIEESPLIDFIGAVASDGQYYYDHLNQKLIRKVEFDGKELYVEEKIIEQSQWSITKEKKQIGDFQCYKAVRSLKINGKIRKTVAWFTPEIPLKLGPKNYIDTLPGLILELDEPLVRYSCTFIDFKKKNQITFPSKVNVISQMEFDELTKSSWDNIVKSKKY